jgi:hypothetical protein
MCESEPYVEVANVSKVYQNGRADAVEAVSSVSFVACGFLLSKPSRPTRSSSRRTLPRYASS